MKNEKYSLKRKDITHVFLCIAMHVPSLQFFDVVDSYLFMPKNENPWHATP
jgi:hypothetical protein